MDREREYTTPQAAAIPIREDGRICLITKSSGHGWGIPKGMVDPGMTAEETALQETWEEAGLSGNLHPDPVGSYEYQKWGLHLAVEVFLLQVTEIHDDWPEQQWRDREWVTVKEALARIQREEVCEIIKNAVAR